MSYGRKESPKSEPRPIVQPPTAPTAPQSTYRKVSLSGPDPVPGYAEGKNRTLIVGERGVVALEQDPLGLMILGVNGTVIVPLARIAWLQR